MTFWIVTSLMALATAGLLALVLLRPRAGTAPAAASDLQVYRDQLKEIDRDLTRGVVAEADAERARAEVSRRILAADAEAQREMTGGTQSRAWSGAVAAVLGLGIIGGAYLLYGEIGAPGYPDLSLETRKAMAEQVRVSRISQDEAEARIPPRPAPDADPAYVELIEQLRQTVKARPDDLKGQTLLVTHEANLGNFGAAHQAKARVVALKGDAARALDHAELAELMVAAAGGYVSPEAEAALVQALELDPEMGPARYFYGLMLWQIGRPDRAFVIWEQTLRDGPPGAPWIEPIQASMELVAALAGVDYEAPVADAPVQPGPSQEDIAAAAEMSDADRQEMIRSMVARLSDRLASEGGPPADWARLIGALAVLGEAGRAQAIADEAARVFAADPQAAALIAQAATRAGLNVEPGQ